MSKFSHKRYALGLVVTLTSLGLVLQACGQAKLTKNATPAAVAAKTPADAAKEDVVAVTDSALVAAKELKFDIQNDSFDVKLISAANNPSKDGKITGAVELLINGEDLKINISNNDIGPMPADIFTADVPTKLPYKIQAKGIVDDADPSIYYLVLSMTPSDQDPTNTLNTSTTQNFAVVYGLSGELKSGLLVADLSPIAGEDTDSKALLGLCVSQSQHWAHPHQLPGQKDPDAAQAVSAQASSAVIAAPVEAIAATVTAAPAAQVQVPVTLSTMGTTGANTVSNVTSPAPVAAETK